MGLIALCLLLFVLLIVRTTMHYWVHPARDIEKEQQLVKAWHAYQQAATDSANSHLRTRLERHDSVVRVRQIIRKQPDPGPPEMMEVRRYKGDSNK